MSYNYDPELADENLWLETEDAFDMTRRLGREEGILVGVSAGANVFAARQIGKRVVRRFRGHRRPGRGR